LLQAPHLHSSLSFLMHVVAVVCLLRCYPTIRCQINQRRTTFRPIIILPRLTTLGFPFPTISMSLTPAKNCPICSTTL
ncbi:hypothetical protein FRC03_004251, partial [Tulasnella sp. 419]